MSTKHYSSLRSQVTVHCLHKKKLNSGLSVPLLSTALPLRITMLLARLPRMMLYVNPSFTRGSNKGRIRSMKATSIHRARMYTWRFHRFRGMVANPPCKIHYDHCTPVAKPRFEPDISVEPDVPSYILLNLQIRGYDYTILERFQGYIHKLCRRFGLDVGKTWITPATTSKVQVYKAGTDVPISEYHLSYYERNVQLPEISATLAPLLLDVLHSNLPEGVTLALKYHDVDDDAVRYIPDLELKKLKDELAELEDPKRKRDWQK